MPIDTWMSRLQDNREVQYCYEHADGLVVATARIVGTPVVYTHQGIQGPMTHEQVEAEFEHDLAKR